MGALDSLAPKHTLCVSIFKLETTRCSTDSTSSISRCAPLSSLTCLIASLSVFDAGLHTQSHVDSDVGVTWTWGVGSIKKCCEFKVNIAVGTKIGTTWDRFVGILDH